MNELQTLPKIAALTPLDTAQIAQTDTATLRHHLARSLTLTAQTLSYLAAIWGELERRGEDLSDLRSGMATYLPQIAHGRLDAELVVKYAGQKMLLSAAAKLPLHAQRELVETGTVKRIIINEEGGVVREDVPLQRLAGLDVRYIFADERLRSEAEQLELRQKAQRLLQRVKKPYTARKISVDAARESLLAGNIAIPLDKILEALSEFYDIDLTTTVKRELETRKALSAFEGKIK